MRVWTPSPMKCGFCRYYACYEELPICKYCLPKLQTMLTEKCPNCGRPAQTCECDGKAPGLIFFNTVPSRNLLYLIKTNADERIINFMAELMIKACGIKPNSFDGVTYVPRLKRNVHRYGYDQSKELAKSISEIYGIPLITLLKRVGGKDQKLLSRSERIKNIRGRYEIINQPEEKYRRLLLIDDVSTTGATIAACKSVLSEHAAKSVVPLVLGKTILRKR